MARASSGSLTRHIPSLVVSSISHFEKIIKNVFEAVYNKNTANSFNVVYVDFCNFFVRTQQRFCHLALPSCTANTIEHAKTAEKFQKYAYTIIKNPHHKSMIFNLRNGVADTVFYSCLDKEANEDDLYNRMILFEQKYDQEEYTLKDGKKYESELEYFTYNYDTDCLAYIYEVFFAYENGIINNDYGTVCMIDENGSAITPAL